MRLYVEPVVMTRAATTSKRALASDLAAVSSEQEELLATALGLLS